MCAVGGGCLRQVVDFQWNPVDPWTLASVSDDVTPDDSGGGGGTLQLWRISDLITRPEEEVLAELEQYRWVLEQHRCSTHAAWGSQPSCCQQRVRTSAAQ